MKKLLLSLSILLLLTSCGDEVYEQYVDAETFPVTVYQNQWVWDGTEGYFYSRVEFPEITPTVIERGIITTYYVANVKDRQVMYPLPYDYYEMDGSYRWTEQSTCEISPGMIKFITKYNDFNNSVVPPTLNFKVSILFP